MVPQGCNQIDFANLRALRGSRAFALTCLCALRVFTPSPDACLRALRASCVRSFAPCPPYVPDAICVPYLRTLTHAPTVPY